MIVIALFYNISIIVNSTYLHCTVMFCLICLFCIELSVLILFGAYTPVDIQFHCYDEEIYIYIYHYLQLLSEYNMCCVACRCSMCDDNNIFESSLTESPPPPPHTASHLYSLCWHSMTYPFTLR